MKNIKFENMTKVYDCNQIKSFRKLLNDENVIFASKLHIDIITEYNPEDFILIEKLIGMGKILITNVQYVDDRLLAEILK